MALSANSDMKLTSPEPEIVGEGEGDGDTAKAGSGSILKMLAVLVCLTLVAGGVWIGFGERIMVMFGPADGDVPVIAADPAPIKVRPENPGGMQVPNQGRLVYGVVDGSSTQPRVERLLPSPEKPVAVDQVLKRSVPETTEVVTNTAPRGTADPSPTAPVRLTPGAPPTTPLANVPSAADVNKLQAPAPAPAPVKKAATAEEAVKVEPAPAPPAAPAATPAAPPVPSAPAPVTAPAPTRVAQASPAPASPDADIAQSWRIQLAASRSEPAVKSEWDRLRRRHVDLLGELRLQVMRIDLGATKGVFYRLRAGPLAGEAAAKTLCQRLKQRKLGCLVVKPGA